ncbi:thioredoxin domain-containing protein [sediment metagenome]|uniref:Thioredoxin domain-containing protein n=1 Tax=sediment metagenome TaxID=749907 RepID=D9PHF9_9ZZZZ
MLALLGAAVAAASVVSFYAYVERKPELQAKPVGDAIKWYGYEAGLAVGKKEGKKVFLFFKTDWCTYCRKMEIETFQQTDIFSHLKENFISIKIDSDREGEVASRFLIKGVPTSCFLAETGETISSLPGYVPPDVFLSILRYVSSDSYKTMTFKNFLKTI